MRNWLAGHPQDRFALNTYSLDQYGLTVEQLKPVFAEYLEPSTSNSRQRHEDLNGHRPG